MYSTKDRGPLSTSLTVPRTRTELSRLTVCMPWYTGKWKQMGSGQGEGLYSRETLHKFTLTRFYTFKKIKSLGTTHCRHYVSLFYGVVFFFFHHSFRILQCAVFHFSVNFHVVCLIFFLNVSLKNNECYKG